MLIKVLGLGVNNQHPVLTKGDKRKYRAYFYNMLSPLQFNKQKIYKDHELEVLGHLAYIKSVDEEYYLRVKFYIFNLLVKFNLQKKSCLKNLMKIIGNGYELGCVLSHTQPNSNTPNGQT